MLNYNSLEALRRAFVAAIKSIEIAATYPDDCERTSLSSPNSRPSSRRCGVHLVRSRRFIGRRIVAACVCWKQLTFAACVFASCSLPGLVEGGFPLRASRDWIYPHEERERLKRYGLTLEDISPATLLKEEHYFYQAACRATERLYLTRPLATGGRFRNRRFLLHRRTAARGRAVED